MRQEHQHRGYHRGLDHPDTPGRATANSAARLPELVKTQAVIARKHLGVAAAAQTIAIIAPT